MSKGTKTLYPEIIRLFAIFFVLFSHTGTAGIHRYQVTESAAGYWIGMVLVSFAQICVPLFFMVSGALLLKREESFGQVYKHRVLRLVIVILLVVLLEYYYNYRMNPAIGFDIKTFFAIAYAGGATTQQWFLYAYLAFLMILPLLQRFAQSIPKGSWFLYLFLLWELLYGICPIWEYYQKWERIGLEIPLLVNIIFYSFMGYYVECRSQEHFYKQKNVLICWGVSLLATAENAYMNHLSLQETGSVNFVQIFVPLYAMTIFITIRYACYYCKIPKWVEKVCIFGGAGVFGTYLMERHLRELFFPIYTVLCPKIHALPAVFLWLLTCMAAGIVLSNLIKKIPVVGKLL